MKDSGNSILSVGIDIGTSTLQLVISRLTIKNDAPAWVVPQFKISKKEVCYKSRIYFTPMKEESLLDLKAIRSIIEREYQNSGYSREQIDTGAIIITGESANKENADAAAGELSEFAGDFVVAVAGPDLESVLAGYGSGAASVSERHKQKVMNFDIGGGTTNTAVFHAGKVCDAWGIHIGGRLIRVGPDKKVLYCSSKLSGMLEEMQIPIKSGMEITFEALQKVCRRLAETLADIAKQKSLTDGQKSLQIYHEPRAITADCFTFSGGVGEFVYQEKAEIGWQDCMQYEDIGPLLGWEIRKVFSDRGLPLARIPERIRATVIGAGSHSMRLSGSTVSFDESLLPLKNVPVVRIEQDADIKNLKAQMIDMARTHTGKIAFSLRGLHAPSYTEVKQLAEQIWAFYQNNQEPVLLLLETDMAKVLGQTLRIISKGSRSIICLDGICALDGDYVDFCTAISGSMLVVIKTLIFKN